MRREHWVPPRIEGNTQEMKIQPVIPAKSRQWPEESSSVVARF